MPKLKNIKWELFSQYVAQGMSQKDAYIEAGYRVKDDRVAISNASKLAITNSDVKARIEEIFEENQRRREELAAKQGEKYSLDFHLKSLKRLAEKAESRGSFDTAVSAHSRMAKAAGLLNAVDGHQGDIHFTFVNELAEDDPNKGGGDAET